MADVIREALAMARRHIVTLGGEPTPTDVFGDQIQTAVLTEIDRALASPSGFAEGTGLHARIVDRLAKEYAPGIVHGVASIVEQEIARSPATERGSVVDWQSIETAPKDDSLIMAWCPPDVEFPSGRMMIWRASILAMQNHRTPNHLQFPATHWRPLPAPPERGDHLSGEGR